MRLKKSYDDKKLIYTMSFEISPTEMVAAGGARVWESRNIADYVEMLQKIAGMTTRTARKKRTFEDILRDAQQQAYNAYNYQAQFNQQYAQGFGQGFGQNTSATRTPPKPAWATILGVEPTATKDEIKARYRTLAKQNHPDRGGDPAKFAKISEAYEQATK